MTSTVAERIARRSGVVTIIGLVVLMLLAWAFLLSGAALPAMAGMAVSPGFVAVVIMWWVMMVAMMVPAAAPTILLYAHVHRHSNYAGPAPSTVAFIGGYLACWLVFALIAAGLQTWLVSPMSVALAGGDAAGGLLVAAGLYQLTPFKDACLSHCRSPAIFLSRHYRPGPRGAFRLGMLHGARCIGCCWLLMTLLFVGGVMNLIWVVGLTLLVVAEKLHPLGPLLARIAGIVLVAWGVAMIAG